MEPVGGFESMRQHGKSKVESLPEGQSREERCTRRVDLGDLAAVLCLEEPQTAKTKMENLGMHATGLR